MTPADDQADEPGRDHDTNPDARPDAQREQQDDDAGKGKRSQASMLVTLARERFRLVAGPDGTVYAVERAGPNIARPLRGPRGLRSLLSRIYHQQCGGVVPGSGALTDALTVLEGYAHDADTVPVHLRVAPYDTPTGAGVVIDLGTPDGRCVLVEPGKGWTVQARSPVLFRRTKLIAPLPDPHPGGTLDQLRALVNTDDAGWRLVVGWLLAALVPTMPHPILVLLGESGTAKSSTARLLTHVVDPSPAPLRSEAPGVRDWATTASACWAMALDNISHIPPWFSDALCKAVTGDGLVVRELYTNDDVTVLSFRRVIILTSIDPGALRGDLAERLLTVDLQPITEETRREEGELAAAQAAAHPAALGALFTLLADVLAALPEVNVPRLPRMADFARLLAALDHITGWTTLPDYMTRTKQATVDVLDAEPFATAVIALVEAAGPEGLTLTAQQLLDRITTPDKTPPGWPKDATRVGGKLKRIAPALRSVGIQVETSRGTGRARQRLYTLTRTDTTSDSRADSASAASAPLQQPALTSDNSADTDQNTSVRAASAPPAPASAPTTPHAAPDARADATGTTHTPASAPASASATPTHQPKHTHADTTDAADAETGPLSHDHHPRNPTQTARSDQTRPATAPPTEQHPPPLCAICHHPMHPLIYDDQTTHPMCNPNQRTTP